MRLVTYRATVESEARLGVIVGDLVVDVEAVSAKAGLLLPSSMLTFIDLGPRLIAVTHHDAVGGPYHRNGQQIADVMNAFRGSADQAHRLITKYHSTYLLTCPNSSTTTIFMAETPKGFYAQLEQGKVPNWLQPIPLPKDSPFKMWKVIA